MTQPTILIVEDDPTLMRGLTDNFQSQGYRVQAATDGQQGLDAALGGTPPDLIVLDIMLPKVNGYEVCRLVREQQLEMPIIMLTAKGQEEDIIRGLELGADDYVTKPFSIRELLARIKAFFRRNQVKTSTEYRFGDCRLDLVSHKLFKAGVEVTLTTKEFRMLEYFVQRPGRALTRHDILDAVWGNSVIVTTRSVDRCVTTLRGKVEPEPRHPTYIHTIRDVGYRFEDELSGAAPELTSPHPTTERQESLSLELDDAHQVQQGFLPTKSPEIEGYEFFQFYQAARQLGGDYFDYVKLPDWRLAIVVADVMGKGIPASLVMAKLSAETRYCLASRETPAAAVAGLNHVLCDRSWGGRFVTLVLVVLDPTRHEVTVVNGGHPAPWLRRNDGTLESLALAETELPLGVESAVAYRQTVVTIEPGDSLMLYTDGVSEAMNDSGELYGIERLRAQLSRDLTGAKSIGQAIAADVKCFAGAHRQSDDICVVCVGRNPAS